MLPQTLCFLSTITVLNHPGIYTTDTTQLWSKRAEKLETFGGVDKL